VADRHCEIGSQLALQSPTRSGSIALFAGSAARCNAVANPKSSDVYRKIDIRLGNFRPAIQLDQFIKSDLRVGPTVLDGITFVPKKWDDLITSLRIAKTLSGETAFAEGKDPERPGHWALDASMAATIGKGFREIWRPQLSSKPLSLADLPGRRQTKWNAASSSRFGDDPTRSLDLTSLHFAVAPGRVNIHIDQTGFVLVGPTGELVVDPDFEQHIVNELLWKSKATRILPENVVDRISIMLPSSQNDFARLGISGDALRLKNYKVTVTGSCSIRGGFECSATVGVSGNF
jgi:hypothetical protein